MNPSFEENSHCITEDDVNKYTNIPSLFLSQCENWASFSNEGTADLFQPCNAWRFQSSTQQAKARTGVSYSGLYAYDRICCENEYREYLVGKLKSGLERGKNYEVSFWVLLYQKSIYATSSLGIYFSQDTVYRLDNFSGVAPFQPQLQNPKGKFLSNKEQWTEIHFTYKAQGGERFLMIGNFFNDALTDTLNLHNTEKRGKDSYYQIDDVCVSIQNCPTELTLHKYDFRAMVYEETTNKTLTGLSTEMSVVDKSELRQNSKTENDSKVRFSLPENDYLCFIAAPCYLPKLIFYYVPLVKDGKKMQDQLQYIALTKMEKGGKILVESDISYPIQEMITKKSDRLSHLFSKLDKLAEYLKNNPSIKICLNAGVNFNDYYTDEKKVDARKKYSANLEFIKKYWLDKGVKNDQVTSKVIELTKDNPSISGYVDRIYVGHFTSRYELEIIEHNCKSENEELSFFHKNEKGAVYILDKVFFTPDSPELEQRSFEELDRLSVFLKQHQNIKIRINGHTDIGKAHGSDDFLQKLSDNRAKAVADYLISKGADKNTISYQGFANRKPIADNTTEVGKAQNRRVEVEILEY